MRFFLLLRENETGLRVCVSVLTGFVRIAEEFLNDVTR